METTLEETAVEEESRELIERSRRLDADLRNAARSMGRQEARYIVDAYYAVQESRKRLLSQVREMSEAGEPCSLLEWMGGLDRHLERTIKSVLKSFAQQYLVGRWSLAQHGIGPVISAGLLAHVDITQCRYPSQAMRFAGLDPTSTWLGKEKARKMVDDAAGKGQGVVDNDVLVAICRRANRNVERVVRSLETCGGATRANLKAHLAKRPWNAKLKTLLWHVGECVKRTSASPKSFYGRFYQQWKAEEVERNQSGRYADLAAEILESKNWAKGTTTRAALESGKLSDGHLDARACRKVKVLFFSHWWEVAYRDHYGEEPAKPWIIEHGGHRDYIAPPKLVE